MSYHSNLHAFNEELANLTAETRHMQAEVNKLAPIIKQHRADCEALVASQQDEKRHTALVVT